MKVLFINVDCGAGSTGRICVDLAKELISRGNEACVAYGRDVSKEDEHLSHRVCSKIDVWYHALITRIFDRTGFGCKISTFKFIHWIKKYNPDIIHLHNLHGYYIDVEILFKFLKTYGKPIYWTLHDCWAFTGHCTHFDYIQCKKWKTGCYNCPQKKMYPKSFVFDSSKRNYLDKKRTFTGVPNLTIITPSNWLNKLVKESFLKEYNVVTIHNGIDTDVFKKESHSNFKNKYNIEDKKIILGVASPWRTRKGFDDFIKLSKLIPDDFIIVLVGVSDKQKKMLPNNIIGIKRTTNVHEMVDIYSSAFAFANLTYEDNYPTTNLEAQACGSPCITYKTGGSVESVPLKNIVPVGDVNMVCSLLQSNLNLNIQNLPSFSKVYMLESYMKLMRII